MTRVIVFCIAAFFSAIAGILYGGLVNFATASDRYYQSFTSLILLAVLALAPFREPWYAVFAGLTAVIPGYLTGADTTYWLNVIFGLFAILVALQGGPAGMPRPTADVLRPPRATATGARAGSRDHGWDRPGRTAAPSRAGRCQRDQRAGGRPAHRPLRWSAGGRQPQLPCADGPDHRAHRTQRRRQDDDVQRVQRAEPPVVGTDPPPRRGRLRASPPRRGPASASAARSSSCSCASR